MVTPKELIAADESRTKASRLANISEDKKGVHSQENTTRAEGSESSSAHAGVSPGHSREHLLEFIRVFFIAAAAAIFWFVSPHESRGAVFIAGILCAFVGGFSIFREALENILERRMTMELSMAIAIAAALAIREIFTALVIMLFVLVAEILEGLTVRRGRRSIQQLLDLLPATATKRIDSAWTEVSIDRIRRGDVVLVRPGGRIPVDGSVTGGHSFVDQAAITGESVPVEKVSGAEVFAGTINQSGALEVAVERFGRDTTFGKIIEEVERAERSKAPIQKTADRLAGYLVYFALGAAGLTFLITRNVRSTISVVIVAGACGIAAGTPLAILGAIGRAARKGAIIKGGRYLEALARADTVILDKTGTLTFGTPEVLEVRPVSGVNPDHLLKLAASAELRSEHPVGKAIVKKAAECGIQFAEPVNFDYIPGKGVVAVSATEVVVGNRRLLEEKGVRLPDSDANVDSSGIAVAENGRFLGTLRIGDKIRPEAKRAIAALKSMEMKTILLTGDSRQAAEEVGNELGVQEIASELLPSEKLDRVKALVAQGKTVVMVGDGINDAPALMQANVGVAMGSGTDVARESSSVVLIGNDLSKFVETLQIARRCRSIIYQNFTGTLVVDGIGMTLAAVGLLNPLLAAFIHVSSELIFIANSARMVSFQRPQAQTAS